MNDKDDNTVYITSKVNEIFASTELTQYFTNPLENSIELTILFPIKEEINLSKFVVSMDDQIIVSKVMPKEKAEEKYNDAIASGNVGVISSYQEKQNAYSVNIGNIKPKKQIKLYSIFIQMIGTQDMSYEFSIMEKYPSFYYKEIKNNSQSFHKKILANFEIQTQSKITRLIAPFYDEEAKKNSKYNVKYSPDFKKALIEYSKSSEEIKLNSFNKQETSHNTSFSILFRTENMNKPLLCAQYNPEFKETAYSINYIYASKNLKEIPVPEKPDEDINISYTAKYEENITNETPGLFIFLIDQSGSMYGKPNDLVKQALLLFLQSLPEKSYFQLIAFGSRFEKYNKEPVEYNKENVENATKIINSFDADLGGTNISGPLDSIFKDDCYSKINLSKNIFLLTDGDVDDREQCFNLISTNSGKFRVHSIGIGKDFDKVLIEKCGKLGKGTSSFVQELDKINSVIIDVLNKSLRPYITDIKFEFENYKDDIDKNIISCSPINNFTYQNEVMNYSFILQGKKELPDLKVKIVGKDPINLIESSVSFENLIKLEDGEEMSKMIVGKALNNNEEFKKDEKKEIEFAKKYQILSKNTSLFAEIINDENQQDKLIKVELNEFKAKEEPSYNYSSSSYSALNSIKYKMSYSRANYDCCCAPLRKCCCCCCAAPKSYASKKKSSGNNFLGSIKNKIKGIFSSNESSSYKSKKSKKKSPDRDVYAMPEKNAIEDDDLENNSDHDEDSDDNYNISNNYKSDIQNNNKNNDNSDNKNNTSLILSQDIIEGFWDENNETKRIINIITSDVFDKIKNKIIPLNKGQNETKIIYTILVVYYLKTKCADNLNEYRLVINKANKFLSKNGINYDDIVSGI